LTFRSIDPPFEDPNGGVDLGDVDTKFSTVGSLLKLKLEFTIKCADGLPLRAPEIREPETPL
jgi:hypothetical protein